MCSYERLIDKVLLESEIDTKDSFHSKLDELHIQFYDWYSRENNQVTFQETKLIREVFQFLKNQLGGN